MFSFFQDIWISATYSFSEKVYNKLLKINFIVFFQYLGDWHNMQLFVSESIILLIFFLKVL